MIGVDIKVSVAQSKFLLAEQDTLLQRSLRHNLKKHVMLLEENILKTEKRLTVFMRTSVPVGDVTERTIMKTAKITS